MSGAALLDFLTEGDFLDDAEIPSAYTPLGRIRRATCGPRAAPSPLSDEPGRWQSHMFPVDDVVEDINPGVLPPVTWITPRLSSPSTPSTTPVTERTGRRR